MSAPNVGSRELVTGFTDVIRPALVAHAPETSRVAAREVAQLLALPGLEAALAELERHPSAPRPAEVEHLAERIARIARDAAESGEIAPFQVADRELAAIALQLAGTDWGTPVPAGVPGAPTLTVEDAFSDLVLSGPAEARAARLTVTVASAVRAAVDWLGVDESPRVTLELRDSALAITVAVTHEGGIGPAGAVLAAAEGSLGREADGRWTIRIPVRTERPSFLLLRQGRYGVALPWHSVARLRMFAPHEIERLEEPRLAPLSAGTPLGIELPAALVAIGLARAWFVADRIVWRIAASPREAEVQGPFAGATHEIVVETGERYWVLDPAWLLRGVAAPDVAPPTPRPRLSAAAYEKVEATPPAVIATAPAPLSAPAPAPAGESLADAVERALEYLRHERGHDLPRVVHPSPAADAPAAEPAVANEPLPLPVPDPAPELALPDMIDAALEVLLPGLVPVTEREPEPAPQVEPEAVVEMPAPDVVAAPEPEVVEAPAPELAVAPATPVDDPVAPEPVERAEEPAPTPTEWVVAPEPELAPPPAPEVAPAPPAPRAAQASPAAPRAPEKRSVRRALVADDSLVARIFLARLLEKEGYLVEQVELAADLWAELDRGPWALVCADFALPDAQGAGHVGRLLYALQQIDPAPPCIVLTRDANDEREAQGAGATALLRKPFEASRLLKLLPR